MNTSTNLHAAPASGNVSMLPQSGRKLFYLVTVLFFLWGMSNNLTDILVQQFRKSFELSAAQAQLVQTAVFLGYFSMAIPAAMLMQRKGYKSGMMAGLLLFGFGTIAFWPAAILGSYASFLAALFMVGCGSAILESAANPFIAQFGPAETAGRRLNLAQAFNPPGTITGVLLGTYFIFSGVEMSAPAISEMKAKGTYAAYLHGEIMRVVPVYVGLGLLVLFWALLIARAQFPPENRSEDVTESHASLRDLVNKRYLWLAVVAQFFNIGGQIATWSAFIPYLKQYTQLTERSCAHLLTGCLLCFALGRVLSTIFMRWIPALRLLLIYAALNTLLVLLTVTMPGFLGAGAVLASSFLLAPTFPTIFASGLIGLGNATKLGGSLIVMSIVGGALFPPLLGLIARIQNSYAQGYIAVVVCHAVVALYALLALRRSDESNSSEAFQAPTISH